MNYFNNPQVSSDKEYCYWRLLKLYRVLNRIFFPIYITIKFIKNINTKWNRLYNIDNKYY